MKVAIVVGVMLLGVVSAASRAAAGERELRRVGGMQDGAGCAGSGGCD